jgi:hypothetical protein
LLTLVLLAPSQDSGGSSVDGRASMTVAADVLPSKDVSELRPQLGAVMTASPSEWFSLQLDAAVDLLLARRGTTVKDAQVRVRDVWAEARGSAVDVRGGYGRLVWGRLDEISPSDVINPLDAAKFLFEGRSEARLAVPFVRTRVFPSDAVTVEAVLVPRFRRGTFDLLDEETSPFNLVNDLVLPAGATVEEGRRHEEPPPVWDSWDALSGGGRVQITVGRVDLAASAFRGFDAFGPLEFRTAFAPSGGSSSPTVVGELVEVHPRFTMYAADFETVSGSWAWRGEVAVFPERTFSAVSFPGLVKGRSVDAGIGFDRQAGPLRVFGSVVVHREEADRDPRIERTDLSLIGSVDRAFRQEQLRARAFAVVNPDDQSAFIRGLFLWKLHDRAGLELSAGTFLGTSDDTIGRFEQRDFAVARLRYDFR